MNKKLLDMDNKEARKFFLKNESYFTLKLPSYFNFEKLLKKIYTDNSNKKHLMVIVNLIQSNFKILIMIF